MVHFFSPMLICKAATCYGDLIDVFLSVMHLLVLLTRTLNCYFLQNWAISSIAAESPTTTAVRTMILRRNTRAAQYHTTFRHENRIHQQRNFRNIEAHNPDLSVACVNPMVSKYIKKLQFYGCSFEGTKTHLFSKPITVPQKITS